MTKKEFDEKFHGISTRAYSWSSVTRAPAPWPKFDPAAINIREIELECRPKDAMVELDEKKNAVLIDWESQEDCSEHSLLDAEIKRAMSHIGFHGPIHIRLFDRDGYDRFEYELEA